MGETSAETVESQPVGGDPESPVVDVTTAEAETDELGSTEAKPTVELSEEAVVGLIAERDEYLEALQRLKAEFANARRRSNEQAAAQRLQAAADLVEKLLPVLDSCDAALDQGIDQVKPISEALFEVLSAKGLRRVDPVGEPFDPQLHEAVLHEAGDGEQVVVETLRAGYSWNDRVLRPAMVKVQG
jgi:molecular chaperone GrpE